MMAAPRSPRSSASSWRSCAAAVRASASARGGTTEGRWVDPRPSRVPASMTVSPFLAPGHRVAGLEAGDYVTDGYNLFAILSVATSRSEPLVTYEDCRTLELLVCPLAELRTRRLEMVRRSSVSNG